MMSDQSSPDWDTLIVTPDEDAVAELRNAWSWLLEEPWQPVLFTAMGDMFFQDRSGGVFWLDTGAGTVSSVAENLSEFERLVKSDGADEWLLPDLVSALIGAGKLLDPQQCYSFVILPVFKEGTYSTDNLNAVRIGEHFGLTGELHKQIRDLPDGSTVQLKVVD
jgi:hypothetical protein